LARLFAALLSAPSGLRAATRNLRNPDLYNDDSAYTWKISLPDGLKVVSKAVWYRKHLAMTPHFFPSSKLCRGCEAINTALILSDRVWICGCGAVHDRDLASCCKTRA